MRLVVFRFVVFICSGILLTFTNGHNAFAQIPLIYQYNNITGQTTTTLKSVPGVLHAICFNNPVATEVITIYDNSTNSGTKIGTITVPSSPQPVCLTYDVQFGTGLTIVTATASSDITVSYR